MMNLGISLMRLNGRYCTAQLQRNIWTRATCPMKQPPVMMHVQLRRSHWMGGFMNGWHVHRKANASNKRCAKKIERMRHIHKSKRRKWKKNTIPGASRMMKGQ